ncbi:MAG: thermonuclease family protein [Paracoccaceae bacterium]
MLTFRSALVLILALLAQPSAALTLTGRAYAVDGDTLDIAGHRLRLFGIDAPERAQTCSRMGKEWACGEWARETLAKGISGASLSCDLRDRDKYGRSVATCAAGSVDLGRMLVYSGAALAYLRYSSQYQLVEAEAATAGRGIWTSQMQIPEDYRHRPSANAPDQGCAIKGNISAKGRIFHLPGQKDYLATRINRAKGEGFFCSIDDAKAAGFRAALR